MKKNLFARLGVWLTLVVGLTFVLASPAYATVVTGTTDHTGNFASDLPIGTVTIDTTNMGPTNPNMQFSSTNPEIVLDSTTEDSINHPSVAWRPNEEGDTTTPTLNIGESKTLEGEVTLTWPGIATLQDGSTADVVMTISNISFTEPWRGTRDSGFRDDTLVGPLRFFWTAKNNGQTYLGPRGNLGGTGMEATVNVKVVGAPAGATVLFSTNDLDVVDYKNGGQFNESFEVVGGAVSDIVVPTDTVLKIEGDKLAAENGQGDSNTYKTGFVVLADANEGITLTWRGAGRAMGTSLFTGNISHHIDSTSGKGGSIKTTTTGKVGEGDELGPVRAEVPDGKDVSYLMEPDDGYKLDTIKVDGKVVDPDDPSTWPDFIEVTKDENSNPIVTFKDNAADHTIDVTWQPVYTVTYDANGGSGTMDDQEFAGSDEQMMSKDNEFTKDGSKFTGFKAYITDPETGEETPLTDENGEPLIFESAEDLKSYLDGKPSGTSIRLEAQWEKLFTVTFEDGDHGTSSGGNQTGVSAGEHPQGGNSVTPDKGYEFSGTYKYVITHEDGTTEEGETDDPTSIEVTGDIVFTPVYKPIVTATSGEGGSTTDSGTTVVDNGSSKTFTFTPEPGYTIDTVTVNGQKVTPVDNGDGTWSYTIENITEPTELVVNWKKTKTVTYVDPITGETIQVDTIGVDDAEPPAPADPSHDGYTFKGWKRTVDADGNILYEAIWEPIKSPSPFGPKPTPTRMFVLPKTSDPANGLFIAIPAGLSVISLAAAAIIRKRNED